MERADENDRDDREGPRPFVVPLEAIEAASPTEAVTIFGHRLGEQVDAEQVGFLITDFAGQALVRLTPGAAGDDVEQVSLTEEASPYVRTVIEQQVQVVSADPGAAEGEAGEDAEDARIGTGRVRVVAPVTARGDAIGVLDLVLPVHPEPGTLDLIADAAHSLAYVITTESRHTDLYEWGRRSCPVSLAAEIQRQLLPEAFTCEAGEFTLAAWLEPSNTVGGDTFDYALDADRLYLSLTDAMGHDVDAALMATLAVGSLRNSRRASGDLSEMAGAANGALTRHHDGLGLVTGLLCSVDLTTGTVLIVNAGHPAPLLVRGGQVEAVPLSPDLPLGVLEDAQYRVQEFALQPGDRLVLLTDGMLERNAREVDLPALLLQHADTHPRQLMQVLTTAVQEAAGAQLVDDATAMCLHWYGTDSERSSRAGASGTRS